MINEDNLLIKPNLMKYRLNSPSLGKKEIGYVNSALKSNWLSFGGKNTKIFEKKFAKFLGIKHVLAVQSGTAALHLALKTVNIKPGDNVIIPNYSCVASISSTTQSSAKPVVVEVENDTLGLDFSLIKNAIKKYNPKALQLVHVYGFPARDSLKIKKYCNKKKITLIEDCSGALGAEINNRKVGTLGDISIFSVRSDKMIGVGEGGVICTNKSGLFNKIQLLAARNAPHRSDNDHFWKKYYHLGEGYNYLMPHLLGSVARAQIERFKKELLYKKIKVGNFYRKLRSKNFRMTQKVIKNTKPVYWLNSIYFYNLGKNKVRKIGHNLMKHGIEVRSGFWPLSDLKKFSSKYVGNRKISRDIFEKTLVLPSNINLNEKDIKLIVKKVEYLIKKIN